MPVSTFDKTNRNDLWIFDAPLPGSLADDLAQSRKPGSAEPLRILARQLRSRFSSRREDRCGSPIPTISRLRRWPPPWSRSSPAACANCTGIRLSDEWQYYISGTARMGVFLGEGRHDTVEFHPSDVGYVPQSIGHYVENIGKDTLRFLEVFATGEYADISLASWIATCRTSWSRRI